eukprot:NODE_23637_length_657_cov_5.566038.p2 GENE.NODE_23637_length_657_cov_5.566038~~NODE_23637_length_657_cov_5.566038.p2  ORF type:complete len:72 (+),score=10.45 NODE_23637_length_657_cov_5.566038:349-564(+)
MPVCAASRVPDQLHPWPLTESTQDQKLHSVQRAVEILIKIMLMVKVTVMVTVAVTVTVINMCIGMVMVMSC